MRAAKTRSNPGPSTPGTSSKPIKKGNTAVPTSKTDIVISIKPKYMEYIVARTKNHEFRKYLIASTVQRMWLYVSSPDQTLRYVAVISNGKAPGEIEVEDGMGNAMFNVGEKKDVAAYAYEIKELYQLRVPLPLLSMQSEYGITFPQRFAYANHKLLDAIDFAAQIKLF